MEQKIKEGLEQIRPFLQRDGGDVQFIDLTEDGWVVVELQGHCAGCPHAQMTIKNGIENIIRDQYPEIAGVRAINEILEEV